MTRTARVIVVDYPHHVTQRGNNQQTVFFDDSDRKEYLALIKKYSQEYDLSVLSYCLMPNHVHFIAIPHNEFSLSKTFSSVNAGYSRYANKKEVRSGHLWQCRFYSCVLDESHLIMAARYIENNPVRAKLVRKAWDWKWSSANFNIGNIKEDLIINKSLLEYINSTPTEWKTLLEEKENMEKIEQIRKKTKAGLPLVKGELISDLEKKLNRELQTKSPGRPRHRNN
jgi:putative transposase